MYKCHEGHEIHELYHRLDFRCDCGTGRMTEVCQLEDKENPKDFDNTGNKYDNSNFFDIYCHCNKRYNDGLNALKSGHFMLQCYNCEDWIHNDHMLPVQEQVLPEEYILICRKCITHGITQSSS